MTQEEKDLLLKDLSARLFYGIRVWNSEFLDSIEEYHPNEILTLSNLGYYIKESIDVKPYLRPLSSMTEKEKEELNVHGFFLNNNTISNVYTTEQVSVPGFKKVMKEMYTYFDVDSFVWLQEFFNSYHLDYRGLIPMGLALEASANMYKTE